MAIDKELFEMCKGIQQEIFRLYDGLDLTDEKREEMEENGDATSLWDYFNDALDIEYRIGYDMSFRSARIAVTLGGPNIYVDTGRGVVEGFWGTDHAEAWLPSEVCEEINCIFEDLFACAR